MLLSLCRNGFKVAAVIQKPCWYISPAHTFSWQNHPLKRRNELKLPKYTLVVQWERVFAVFRNNWLKDCHVFHKPRMGVNVRLFNLHARYYYFTFLFLKAAQKRSFCKQRQTRQSFLSLIFSMLICETEIVTWGITFKILLGFETYTQEFKTVTVTSLWLIFIKIWGQYHDKTCT